MSSSNDQGKKGRNAGRGAGTRAVHAGSHADLRGTQPSNVPIYASSSFLSPDAATLDEVLGGTRPGYVYGRYANPTVSALEEALAALDGAAASVAFGSGMAALHAAFLVCELEPGDTILAGSDLYGASHTMLATLFGQFDVQTRFADMTDFEAVEQALRTGPRPRAMLFETASNPLIKVADVPRLCEVARSLGVVSIADATFTPPPIIQPLALGADIVMHSDTKYFGGHGDVTGGHLSIANPELEPTLRQITRLAGAIPGPFEAYLTIRGVKTLVVRVKQQCENAAALAQWLAQHPLVTKVHYPGLPDHAQHEVAARIFTPPYMGAMLAFEIAGAGKAEVLRFMDSLELVIPAATLGDVYTEVSYPVISSHRDWAPAQLKRAGITPGLLRVSVGIEDIEDVMEDIDQALQAAVGATNTQATANQ
ncbi:MAG: PLP-dependent aspartate aminotransferase family protein [Chloroflexota bacterium]|nr:PLP-dependent aspartate aminotransferase family protein [Chloroflexota bacterium]MDQ5866506.1 PLP-dependent aspartate aminotransferase family protein [Chloroflexota bacterium]